MTGAGHDRVTVMVVEDHRMFGEGLELALGSQPGISVVGIAANVAEAKTMAAVHRPDVVLMDYRLPDGNGVEAARLVRQAHPGSRVLLLTAGAEDNVLVEAIAAGCSGYLTKDKSVGELVAAIRAAHAGTALISPSTLARLVERREDPLRGAELTVREVEVLNMLAEGMTNQAIADRTAISVNTVRNHVQSIISKLGAHSKLEAVAVAVREGIIRFPA